MLRLKTPKRIPEKFYTIMILVFFVLSAFMAVAPEAIYILAGNKYSGAIIVIPAVTSSVLFMLMSDIFGNIEFYHDKNKFATYVSIVIAVLNLGLNYAGIKLFGFAAAGYTTLICYLLAAIWHYFYVEKLIKKEYGEQLFDWRIVIGLTVAMVAVVIFMVALYSHPVIRYAVIVVWLIFAIIKREWIISTAKELRKKK